MQTNSPVVMSTFYYSNEILIIIIMIFFFFTFQDQFTKDKMKQWTFIQQK